MMDDAIAKKLDQDHGETRTASISRCFFCQPVNRKDKSVDLPEGVENDHKTLKPIELCKHLAQLIRPPERDTPRKIVIPYAGTGSEMIGALLAGWDYVHGIEIDEHYVHLARQRFGYWRRRIVKE
jgi:DNA modification methylase